LGYDKQEKPLFKYTLCNDDFSNKQVVNWSEALNQEIVTRQRLGANQFLESCGKGQLKGKLKEIAAALDEESNPVIMPVKHKK
jgi:hypothetical protein